jgi:uncharacterized protein (UPF0264 family)
MAGLLVSVRSADEAIAALSGGATVIDVKEPRRGPLGRADSEVWRAVREVVPDGVPISVALGELPEWEDSPWPSAHDFKGLSYRKLGLAATGPDWAERWARLRAAWGGGPAWVAVAYADWQLAQAPHPDDVLEAALRCECAGILLDTWDKASPSPLRRMRGGLGETWLASWIVLAQAAGLRVALAGGLDETAIARLSPLDPDLFAVRGAACGRGRRTGTIDPRRVARLAQVVSRSSRMAQAV